MSTYRFGVLAFRGGADISANPYKRGFQPWEDWRAGWTDAGGVVGDEEDESSRASGASVGAGVASAVEIVRVAVPLALRVAGPREARRDALRAMAGVSGAAAVSLAGRP